MNPKQIAEGAAGELGRQRLLRNSNVDIENRVISIIKAAIEKADTESYREGVAAGIATTLQEQQPKASPSHCPACNGDELAKIGDEWVECPGIQPKSE